MVNIALAPPVKAGEGISGMLSNGDGSRKRKYPENPGKDREEEEEDEEGRKGQKRKTLGHVAADDEEEEGEKEEETDEEEGKEEEEEEENHDDERRAKKPKGKFLFLFSFFLRQNHVGCSPRAIMTSPWLPRMGDDVVAMEPCPDLMVCSKSSHELTFFFSFFSCSSFLLFFSFHQVRSLFLLHDSQDPKEASRISLAL